MRHGTLLRLIDRVYDAATDVNGWQPFLNELSAALGGLAAGLLQHEMRPSGLHGMVTASSAVDPVAAELYGRRYGALDPWGMALARQRQLDTSFLVTSESLVPLIEFRRTEYYTDFARHFEFVRNIALGVATHPGVATTVTVLRGEHMQPFGPRELRIMAALQPHVGRALLVHSRLSEAVRQSVGAGEALDRLQTGVVLLTASGRIIFANRTARTLALTADGFRLDADGPAASDLHETRELRRLLSSAANREQRGGGILRLSRPSLQPALIALVSPLTNSQSLGLGEGPLVGLFVSDPQSGPALDLETLRATYQLTPTEAYITCSLAGGASLREIAVRHQLTLGSTRWYVKQILHKTGTKSQADLLRQLLTGPAAVLPVSPSR